MWGDVKRAGYVCKALQQLSQNILIAAFRPRDLENAAASGFPERVGKKSMTFPQQGLCLWGEVILVVMQYKTGQET